MKRDISFQTKAFVGPAGARAKASRFPLLRTGYHGYPATEN